jgi:hypothetical protein
LNSSKVPIFETGNRIFKMFGGQVKDLGPLDIAGFKAFKNLALCR